MTFESEGLLIVAIYIWLPPASYAVFSDNSGFQRHQSVWLCDVGHDLWPTLKHVISPCKLHILHGRILIFYTCIFYDKRSPMKRKIFVLMTFTVNFDILFKNCIITHSLRIVDDKVLKFHILVESFWPWPWTLIYFPKTEIDIFFRKLCYCSKLAHRWCHRRLKLRMQPLRSPLSPRANLKPLHGIFSI